MAITSINQQILQNGNIYFTFSSDLTGDVNYYIYVNGIYKGTQTDTNYTITGLSEGELFLFDVFDSDPNSSDIEKFYSGKYKFNFYDRNFDVVSYKVQKSVNGSSLTDVNILYRSNNQNYFSFETEFFNDGDEVQYRIIPKYKNGIDGDYFSYSKTVVTYPDRISCNLTDSSGSISLDITENANTTVTIPFPNLFS